ncbi:MAG TPA: hypothetical protein VFG37_12410 [Planctomycetota bacterium]|jgi:MFS family permease|nr:hypothetical protein [Planctomycetota bacterium]
MGTRQGGRTGGDVRAPPRGRAGRGGGIPVSNGSAIPLSGAAAPRASRPFRKRGSAESLQRREARKHILHWAIWTSIAAFICVVLAACCGRNWTAWVGAFGQGLLCAGGPAAVGILIGFLFGIPRATPPPIATAANDAANALGVVFGGGEVGHTIGGLVIAFFTIAGFFTGYLIPKRRRSRTNG